LGGIAIGRLPVTSHSPISEALASPQRESRKALLARTVRLSTALAQLYPEARISLDFETPWQCLVATILSAQCTDERVNRATPELFRQIPDIPAMASAPLELIQRLIVTTGFFRQKSKALQATARALLERFGGEVPQRMDDLLPYQALGPRPPTCSWAMCSASLDW
jgi:endonuclease III